MIGIKRELEFEKDFVKKHKSTMGTFDKKNITITRQHYDHSYTKNIISDCVNDDCLAEMFTYVPACERPKIALVCKKWKRALNTSWFNVKKIELPYWRYHEYSNCLNKYQTSDEKLNFLRSLLDKCGRYLTVLDLTAYGHCDIVPVVNDSCPNLVKLRLRFVSIDDEMLINAFTRLTKLKSLTIVFENMKGKKIPSALINSLRNVADTLTELNFLHLIDHLDDSCGYSTEFHSVFPDLKAINTFESAGTRVHPYTYKHVIENRLQIYINHGFYLVQPPFLSKPLTNIRSLVLTNMRITDEGLYFIANTIQRLDSISLHCKYITDKGVVTLSKMDYLRVIYLNGSGNVTDSSIELLKNLVRVILPRSKNVTEVSVMKLIENSPKLTHFSFYGEIVTDEFYKKAAKISNSRKQLLMYSILPLLPDLKQYESPYFKKYIAQNKEKEKKNVGQQVPKWIVFDPYRSKF